MSVVAALKKKGQIWVVSDKQVVWDKYARVDVAHIKKTVRFKNALIGRTGLTVYGTALSYLAEMEPQMFEAPFDKKSDVVTFFMEFHAFVRQRFSQGRADAASQMAHSEFLVITADKIFEVAENMDVVEYDNHTAIGHPAPLIIGAIDALSQMLDDPAEILTRAYATCTRLSAFCDGEMDLVNATEELARNPQLSHSDA